MKAPQEFDGFNWEYLPCVTISSKDANVIISIDDAVTIIEEGRGLVEGSHNSFFAIDDGIVEIYQYYPGGPASKKSIMRVPIELFKVIVDDLKKR